MIPADNLPLIQVGEEHKRWIQNNNKNKNMKVNMAEKEDDKDSTAIITAAIFTPTKITAEKEDNTDSTVTVTTVAVTSVCESE